MKKFVFTLLLALFVSVPAMALQLTKGGKALMTIVVAKDAPYKNQLAAKELKHFLSHKLRIGI